MLFLTMTLNHTISCQRSRLFSRCSGGANHVKVGYGVLRSAAIDETWTLTAGSYAQAVGQVT